MGDDDIQRSIVQLKSNALTCSLSLASVTVIGLRRSSIPPMPSAQPDTSLKILTLVDRHQASSCRYPIESVFGNGVTLH